MLSNVTSKFALHPKKPLFWPTRCFRCFCCVVGVVLFQDLGKREMLLPNFIIFIRRLVKNLFHFEVTFRWGGRVYIFTAMQWRHWPIPPVKKVAWIRSKTNCFKKETLFTWGSSRLLFWWLRWYSITRKICFIWNTVYFFGIKFHTVSHEESVSYEIL